MFVEQYDINYMKYPPVTAVLKTIFTKKCFLTPKPNIFQLKYWTTTSSFTSVTASTTTICFVSTTTALVREDNTEIEKKQRQA